MSKAKYIDTHCHLFETDFEKNGDEVIKKIEEIGVEYVLLANTEVESLEPLLVFEKKYPNLCKSMVGIHPINVYDDYKLQTKFIEKNLSEHNFIGIGEIGLDYYESTQNREIQKKILEEELSIARENNLPISMHIRNAFEDSLEILKKFQNGNLSGVIHCFSGNIEQAKECLDLGFY
ncbi:MAG: TatD family hydrolase, partial [Cytophagales bacterium]|nr:TatD family hydrolase [Cytophagales bacterium]